ncbi:DUF308 domain-containing protein [Methanobacterium oryzae]|uniref:DUF308 domain-containing protein n=1 Tax=Methanobacterium oryzae TaxID=69540 RepID=UPI003D1E9DC7
MNKKKELILGVLSIILGVIGFTSPLLNVEVASKIAGVSTIFLSIYLMISGGKKLNSSKITGILIMIWGIMLIYSGYNRFTDIYYYICVLSILYYLTAILAIITGLFTLIYGKNSKCKITGLIGIVLGIFYILAASIIQNQIYLGILISLYLILYGFSKIFGFKFYRTKDVMDEIIKKIYKFKNIKK